MREFAADPQTTVHPQTVIEHFGSWNAAKREAGLVPRRFATREELLGLLRELGEELGRAADGARHRRAQGQLPSKSLYWHTFGSLDERAARGRLRRAGGGGAARARASSRAWSSRGRLGRLPKFADWAEARKRTTSLLTEWQVYRMFDARRGAWSTFQFLVRERLVDAGADGRAATARSLKGSLGAARRARRGAARQETPSRGARTAGSGRSST